MKVSLKQFDGPLDLLLTLVTEAKIDIRRLAAGVVLLCLLGLTTTAVAQRYPHQMNTNGHGSRTAAYALTDQIIANL